MYFSDKISIRFSDKMLKKIYILVEKNPLKYSGISDFVRGAVAREIRRLEGEIND